MAKLDLDSLMRERIANELRRFHRNSCYPDAMDFEVDAAVTAIIKVLSQ